MQHAVELILRREWDLLLDAGRAWNQTERNGVIPQLIIITGLLFKGNYREAYSQHEALFARSEDVESQDDPRPQLKAFAETLVKNNDGNAGAHLFLGVTLAQIGELEPAIREPHGLARSRPEKPKPILPKTARWWS